MSSRGTSGRTASVRSFYRVMRSGIRQLQRAGSYLSTASSLASRVTSFASNPSVMSGVSLLSGGLSSWRRAMRGRSRGSSRRGSSRPNLRPLAPNGRPRPWAPTANATHRAFGSAHGVNSRRPFRFSRGLRGSRKAFRNKWNKRSKN